MSKHDQFLNAVVRYAKERPADYALLLNGDWGSGKTHFWKAKIAPTLKDVGLRPVYVSLYGIESIKDIDYQILVGLDPTQSKLGSLGVSMARIGMEKFGVSTLLRSLTPLGKNVVFCFDDLERTNQVSPVSILGYINRFVEHEGIPTLLIAHEAELLKLDDSNRYTEVKEKVVGRTLHFVSDLLGVASSFLQKITAALETEQVLSLNEEIVFVFSRDEPKNLRSMRHAIDHCLFVTEKSRAIANVDKEKLAKLFRLVICVTVEMKRNEARIAELARVLEVSDLAAAVLPMSDQSEATKYRDTFVTKYFDGDYRSVPKVPSVFSWIATGLVDEPTLQEELRAHLSVPSPVAPPSIKDQFLGDIMTMRDADAVSAAESYLDDIKHNIIRHPGTLIRIFVSLIYAAQHGIISRTREELTAALLTSIRQMSKANLLDESISAFDMTFSLGDIPEREVIRQAFYEEVEAHKQRKLDRAITALFELLSSDPRAFSKTIAGGGEIVRELDSVSVFAQRDPAAVAAQILALEPPDIQFLRAAFNHRYLRITNIRDFLGGDQENLAKIHTIIGDRVAQLPGSIKRAALSEFLVTLAAVVKHLER